MRGKAEATHGALLLFLSVMFLFVTDACARPAGTNAVPASPEPAAESSGYPWPSAVRPFDLGPVVTRDATLDETCRLRIFGPVMEAQADRQGRTFRAFRPFYNVVGDPANNRTLREYCWPLGMVKNFQNETFWRFLVFYGLNFDNRDPRSRYRAAFLPIVFFGRDAEGERYFAVFPLGGAINEFLGRDHIRFVLFPLYSYSTINDLKTHNILWPIVSWTKGGNVRRFRVFPLYGRSVREGQFDKHFVLWPIWTFARHTYPESRGHGFVLFPLFGHTRLTGQESWMVIPPLFRWSKAESRRELLCPWPIVQYSSGDVDKLYLWPLWGRKRQDGARQWFCLWPIIFRTVVEQEEGERRHFMALPFVYHEALIRPESAETRSEAPEGSAAPTVASRYFKFWPLFSYRREGDYSRTRVLALWPLKYTASIEKNFSPFWTLYSHVAGAAAKDDELLWGLCRWRRGAEGSRVSVFPLFSCQRSGESRRNWRFLLGLFGYEREKLQKRYRFLYFFTVNN